MIGRTIRTRMALASVIPVLLVVGTIASIFWQGRVQDLEESHQQRVDMLARQVALFSAYGLFSGNTASLQSVVQDIQKAPDVKAVLLFDTNGDILASSGNSELRQLAELESADYIARQQAVGLDVRVEKILPTVVPMEDLFSLELLSGQARPAPLGSAVIEISREALDLKKSQALFTALWVGTIGMLLGGLLAFRLGDWVVGPLLRISQMVKRVGQGDFTVDESVAPDDPLQDLQSSLNQTAKRLAWGREELERQVAEVTRELRLKKEQAESATLAKSRFLAAASHDLRQPSHALGMFVARLGQLPMEPQMRHLVDNLEMSVQAMQDLLDGLLDLSRLDSGNVQVRMGPVDLNELLASVRSSLESMAEAKGLRLRVRPTARWALSDATLLQRMVVNLVINAIRYTERGTVMVSCRPSQQGRGIQIEVRDSGIGIAQEHHQDVFKEFYQLPNSTGDRNFGMGLGLNIVQRSAVLLGHQIVLRSNLGCGTRFSILMDATEAPPAHAIAAPDLPGDITGIQVLLIEDNLNARQAVLELLQSWGCEVWAAASLAEAQAAMHQSGPPDVIVSDHHLGAAETGLDCIHALRVQAAKRLPACLMSGDTHEDFLQAVKEADIPLLHKPVRPAKLRSLLRRLTA